MRGNHFRPRARVGLIDQLPGEGAPCAWVLAGGARRDRDQIEEDGTGIEEDNSKLVEVK
jgi:hypothetical protein